jgi:amino acid adenylation domain-containing protein
MERGCKVRPANPFIEFKKEEIEQSIPARFEEQVHKYPERTAVKTQNRRWSYDELNKAANRAARAILEKRGESEEPIALLLEKDAPMIAAILGVLKAGKIYVPLDPSHPQEKIRAILEDAQAQLIVTNRRNFPLAVETAPSAVRLLDFDAIDPVLPSENVGLSISPDSFAYILYTSGSTGEPKGVVQNHRNVLHKAMAYTNELHFSPDDRISLLSPCTFSLSVAFIYGALLNGACLYPIDVKDEGLSRLQRWFVEEGITVYNSAPTVFRNFTDGLTGQEFPRLRLIHLAGEPVTERDVERYKKFFSDECIFVNLMGATETGPITQFFTDKATLLDGGTVPVGYPSGGMEILLLDDNGKKAGAGGVGEIAVKSRYLAVGYWRKPELTRAAFLPDPGGGIERIYRTGDLGLLRPDGCLEYRGRKDFQVKIRGQRVEPGEIELELLGHPAVKEAVVVGREDMPRENTLAAYIVPTQQPVPPATRELRGFLERKLPDYMIPSVFVFMESFPLTPNGKVDRRALPLPSQTYADRNSDYVAPAGDLERQLAQIWEDLLGVRPIGTQDDFFDLGGHSLLAVEMMHRIERATGEKLPLSALLEGPTVKHLAAALVRQRVGDERSLLVRVQPGGARPPFFFLHGDLLGGGYYCRALAHALGEDQPFYALAPHGLNGSSIPKTVEAMAASYLRIVREAQPEGPYFLGGACNGGLIAFEAARQLERQGQKVDLLVLVAARGRRALARILLHGLVSRSGALFGLGPEEKLDFFLGLRAGAHRVRGLYRNCLYRLKLRRPPVHKELPPGLDDNARAVLHTYSRVVAGYVPGRYPGRVVVLWPDKERFDWRKDPAVGWGRVTSNLEVKIIPGTHTTYMTEHVNVWAAHIKDYLEKAQGKS